MYSNLNIRNGTLLFIGFAFVLFFSSFHLFQSPETWMDEGLIIQSAEGLLQTGKASLPVAPGVFEPGWYVTTGFPLTLPLAGAFAVFGMSLEAARLVMLAFLICFYLVLFLYGRKAIGGTAAWVGFFLLVFFGPIYGDGRNALGEIPGLLCILLTLFPLIRSGTLTRNKALWIGVWVGLAVAAKPIFILFLPALLVAIFLHYRELNLKKVFIFGFCGALIPLLVWVFTQFDQVTLSRMLAFYANNLDIDVWHAIAANIKRLFTEMQPLYFLAALVVWATSYGMRRFRREEVSLSEEVLLFFSVLVFLAYIRTTGYYRYFFPAQVFALMYLPQSLWYLVRRRSPFFSKAVVVCLGGLILFQAYETMFRSWTAVHYNSTRTQELEKYFSTLSPSDEIFVFQAPEVVPFVGKRPLYQYMELTSSIRVGDAYAPLVLSGRTPRVITSETFFQAHEKDVFSHYTIAEKVDSYIIMELKGT